MSIINRNQINQSKPLNGKPFLVPQWGGEVCIKKWSGTTRALLLTRVSEVYSSDSPAEGQVNINDYPKLFRLMAEIVAASICDEECVNLYDIENESDIKELENMDADILQLLFDECAQRNGLLENQIKNEIKNSETIQS